MPGGSHGGIHADRRVDVEVRFVRQASTLENILETLAVISAQEQVMRTELGILLIQAPVEHDGRTAVLLMLDPIGRRCIREQVTVDIAQVRVRNDGTGRQHLAIRQLNTAGASARARTLDQDLFNGGIVHKLHAQFFGNACEDCSNPVHAAQRVPQPIRQLGILHQRIVAGLSYGLSPMYISWKVKAICKRGSLK